MLEGKADIAIVLPGEISVKVSLPLERASFQAAYQILARLAGLMVAEPAEDSEPNEPPVG